MNTTNDELRKRYQEQHTVSGQRKQQTLDQLVNRLNNIDGVFVKSGRVDCYTDMHTGEIKGYFESK